VEAIEKAFGSDVDYGQIKKTYGTEESVEAQRRYSATKDHICRKETSIRVP